MSLVLGNLSQRKIRLIMGGGIVAVLVLIIGLQKLSEEGIRLWQTKEDVINAQDMLKKNQQLLQSLLNGIDTQRVEQEFFVHAKNDYWLVIRDGKVEGEVQHFVQNAADSVKLELSQLSNLKNTKIGELAMLYELSITADVMIEPLIKFFEKIQNNRPKFYWKSCSIRPKSPKGGSEVRFQGELAFVCIVDDQLIELLTKKKNHF